MGKGIFSLLALIQAISGAHSSEITLSALTDDRVSPDPDNSILSSLKILRCVIEPETVQLDEYVSRWIIPNGEILVAGTTTNKHIVSQSRVTPPDTTSLLAATVLVIRELSYTDAGNYTCEVQNSSDSQSLWQSAQITVSLIAGLRVNESRVITFDNQTSVELRCEMIYHIRPDNLFQWFGPDNQRITNGVTYDEGVEQFDGNNRRVDTTRISTLTISNPESSDSGNYTCRVEGTEASVAIELIVARTVSQTQSTGVLTTQSNPPSSTTSITDQSTSTTDQSTSTTDQSTSTTDQSTRTMESTGTDVCPMTNPPSSTTTVVLSVLVAVFGLTSIFLTTTLVIVCLQLYKMKQLLSHDDDHHDYEDIREGSNGAIEMKTNEAYGDPTQIQNA